MIKARLVATNFYEEMPVTASIEIDDLSVAQRFEQAGIDLSLLGDLGPAELQSLSDQDIRMIIDLKRRFDGDLALDPTLFEGSNQY